MTGFIAITCFAMCAMASVGLFCSGAAAMRRATLARREFDLRYPKRGRRRADDVELEGDR